jgi:hypothetical protein
MMLIKESIDMRTKDMLVEMTELNCGRLLNESEPFHKCLFSIVDLALKVEQPHPRSGALGATRNRLTEYGIDLTDDTLYQGDL